MDFQSSNCEDQSPTGSTIQGDRNFKTLRKAVQDLKQGQGDTYLSSEVLCDFDRAVPCWEPVPLKPGSINGACPQGFKAAFSRFGQ